MSGPKRNADKLNTIGIVVVGICGAVLVYVTIVALEAFYVNDTSEVQTMADYGGQDTISKSLRSEQLSSINEYGANAKPAAPKANEAALPQSYHVPVEVAMKLVVDRAKEEPATLIPVFGRSDKGTVLPVFGRPKLIPPPAPAEPVPAPAGGSAAPAAGSAAAGSAAPAAGSAAPAAGSAAPAAGSAAPAAGSAAPAAGSAAPAAGSAAAAPARAATPAKGNGK